MVVRISFGLLIATSLALTGYFGAAAWRLTSDQQLESVGSKVPFEFVRSRRP